MLIHRLAQLVNHHRRHHPRHVSLHHRTLHIFSHLPQTSHCSVLSLLLDHDSFSTPSSHESPPHTTYCVSPRPHTLHIHSHWCWIVPCSPHGPHTKLHHTSPIVSHRALARCTFIHSLFAILVANREAGTFNDGGSLIARVSHFVLYLIHLTRANTLTNSKENIEKHYDLGNDMYKTFLDPTMTYSSAYFKVMHTQSISLSHAIE
jgi:hypothetical protein